MKKYELVVHNGRQIRVFAPVDKSTFAWLEEETYSQCDANDTIDWFDSKDEALSALSKRKNSFSGDDVVDTELFSVVEWEIDEDGELESGTPIAFASWE